MPIYTPPPPFYGGKPRKIPEKLEKSGKRTAIVFLREHPELTKMTLIPIFNYIFSF